MRTLDETSLLRVARAVELARASDRRDPTDEQILNTLRPRLRELKPKRVLTFQRAVCRAVEPFLIDYEPDEKRRATVPRSLICPWWRLLTSHPQRAKLAAVEARYAAAVRQDDWAALDELLSEGCGAASELTSTLISEAEQSIARRGELVAVLGERGMLDLKELALILRLHPQLTPALDRIRGSVPMLVNGKLPDFTPGAVMAARATYVAIHDGGNDLVEFFVAGLLAVLAQPWQALRLVRVLSSDMSKLGEGSANLIPNRLFSDLARTLSEIGRSVGKEGGMSRRLWLLTCARLLVDAGQMIQGLADELRATPNAEWERVLLDARQRVAQAVDLFGSVAVRDCCLVLPTKEQREKGGDVHQQPDLTRRLTEEDHSAAQAAATLFTASRRLADQEGLDRTFRGKEAELMQRIEIGINFRVEVFRARGKNPIALSHVEGIGKVLAGLPQTDAVRDLTNRAERTVERYK